MIWGEQFTAGVLEFRAVKGSTLTLKGEGNQWLQKPTVIPFELTVKVLLGGPLKSNDFVVDLGVNERLLIGGKLENFGETNINGGGIREVGGTFLNHGLLGIPFSDIGHLDVTSFGEVRQKGDVRYGRVSLLPGSRYDIYGAKLLPGGTGLRALDFQAGSKFTASGSGTSRVLKTLDDYVPPIGQGYRIISATEVTGAFAEIEQSEVGRTRRFEVLADDLGVNAVAGELVISSFDDWRAASFTADELANPFLSGATADPDRDGIYNLYEYVTHGLPKKAGPEPFEYRNGKLLLRWANNVSDYRWQLETSVGLESWEPIGAFFSPQGVGPDETVFELVVGGATASSSERYYQLRVLPVEP